MTEIYVDGVRYVPARNKDIQGVAFAKLIADSRKNKRETLQKAADNLGTNKSHLWTLENGRCLPGFELLQEILRYYDISYDEIARVNRS